MEGTDHWQISHTPPPRECEDAQQFFARMEKLDQTVAKHLKDIHEKQIARLNNQRWGGETFKIGDRVYYRRPENSGTKLDSRWLGPAIVTAREGENSYLIEIKEGTIIMAHSTFLKHAFNDTYLGQSVPLYYHKRTIIDPEAQGDEWIVDKIVRHRYKRGELEFFTTWKGFDEASATWEPIKNFFHRYNSELIKYCQDKNIPLNVTKHLPTTTEPPQLNRNVRPSTVIRQTTAVNAVSQYPIYQPPPYPQHYRQTAQRNDPQTWNTHRCVDCGGMWWLTDENGFYWMKNKMYDLWNDKKEWRKMWNCNSCEGGDWTNKYYANTTTCAGMYENAAGKWIYTGYDNEWDW